MDRQARQVYPESDAGVVKQLEDLYFDVYADDDVNVEQNVLNEEEEEELRKELSKIGMVMPARRHRVIPENSFAAPIGVIQAISSFQVFNTEAAMCSSDYTRTIPPEIRDVFLNLKDVNNIRASLVPKLMERAHLSDLEHFTLDDMHRIMRRNGAAYEGTEKHTIEPDTFTHFPDFLDPARVYVCKTHDHVSESPCEIHVVSYSVPLIINTENNRTTEKKYFVNVILHPVKDEQYCFRTFNFTVEDEEQK